MPRSPDHGIFAFYVADFQEVQSRTPTDLRLLKAAAQLMENPVICSSFVFFVRLRRICRPAELPGALLFSKGASATILSGVVVLLASVGRAYIRTAGHSWRARACLSLFPRHSEHSLDAAKAAWKM